LVAIDREGRYLFGECKWRNQKVGEDVLTSLARKASLLSSSVYGLYVCSKSGFTDEALEMAKHNNKFHLINGDELLES
ncbi:restriction endonuclease, partial [Bullifex porci]